MHHLVIPQRSATSRKGQNGRVLIVGGSERYVGALALAGIAALRAGCDIVTIAAPARVAWAVSALSPDLITVKLPGSTLAPEHHATIAGLAKDADVVLFGNGAGRAPATTALFKRLARLPNRKVIDADGIKAIGARGLKDAILTPHRREFELFLKNSGISVRQAKGITGPMRRFVEDGNLILLKGPADQLLSADGVDTVRGGNPGLTKGGTGDVLAGIVAGLWAQGLPARNAAFSASVLNKRVGDILLKRHKGYTYLASDMAREIGRIRRG